LFVGTSLKELLESRVSWRVFRITSWVVYTHSAPRPGGPLRDGSDWLRNRLWDSAVTVLFVEVVRAVLFACGGTPIHPFVNPPALSGSWSGQLGPDTEYSIATVSRTKAVSIKVTLDNRAESMFPVRLALRPRGPLLHQVGGPMQPPLTSLQFLLLFFSSCTVDRLHRDSSLRPLEPSASAVAGRLPYRVCCVSPFAR
jgi:hypothetical protein